MWGFSCELYSLFLWMLQEKAYIHCKYFTGFPLLCFPIIFTSMECTFPVNPCIHLQCITVHCTLKLCALKLRTFTFFPLCKIVWRYDGKKDIYVYVPNYKGAKFDQLHKMSFCCFAPKKWTKEFVFLSWKVATY